MKLFFTILLIQLLNCSNSFAQDYITQTKISLAKAVTVKEKIDAYDKWLPLAILVHDTSAKNDLSALNSLAQTENNTLAQGIYYLNAAYYATESLGDYNSGFANCIKAKDIFESIHAKPQLVATYNRLAFIVLWNEIARKKSITSSNLYDEYLAKALAISTELKDTNLQVLSLNFIGSYFNVTEKNNDRALSNFFDAEKRFSSAVAPENRLATLESISIVFAEMGNEQKALEYEKKSEQELFFSEYGYGKSNMYRSFAKMYVTKNVLDKALGYAQKAFEISKQMKAPEFISRSAERLYEVYKKMGDEKMALAYHEINKTTEDSLSRERFENTFTQYDVAKKEALIATQRLDILKKNTYVFGGLAISLLSIVAAYFLFKRYRQRQKQKMLMAMEEERKLAHNRLVEAEEKERKRIAAELHDNMGVLANAILHNSNMLGTEVDANKQQLVANLQENAKDILSGLRETVWALKTTEVTYTDTWLRIINFVNQAKRNFTHINFETNGNGSGLYKITSVKALHLIMAIKEVVTNAIKHSNSSIISVTSNLKDNIWEITVEDSGIGFNDELNDKKNTEHNGLINIQERAKAGNFSVVVKSEINKGTKVVFKI